MKGGCDMFSSWRYNYDQEQPKKIYNLYGKIEETITQYADDKQIYVLYHLPMIAEAINRSELGIYEPFHFVRRGCKHIVATDSVEMAMSIQEDILSVANRPDYMIHPRDKDKTQPKPYKLNIKIDYVYGDIFLSEIKMPKTERLTKEQIITKAKAKKMLELAELEEKLKDNATYNVTWYLESKIYRRLTYFNPHEQRRKQSAIGDVFIAVSGKPSEAKVIERIPQKTRSNKISQNANATKIADMYFIET